MENYVKWGIFSYQGLLYRIESAPYGADLPELCEIGSVLMRAGNAEIQGIRLFLHDGKVFCE